MVEFIMKIYDISMSIHRQMPVYKGREHKRPIITNDSNFSNSTVYESRIEMNLHTGTHIDSPLHMIENGSNMDFLNLKDLIRNCKVLDFKRIEDKITAKDLQTKDIAPGDFVLLKTRNSFSDILETDFIYLDASGAIYLSNIGIEGVGIDALGIERDQAGHETHKTLMKADIIILEGLRLADVDEGTYFLFAAPLKIAGVEAAPVRALLLDKEV
jgi:arylformamidase